MAGDIPNNNVPILDVLPIINLFVHDMSKLEPFDRTNYKMWYDKTGFFLGQIWVALLFVC